MAESVVATRAGSEVPTQGKRGRWWEGSLRGPEPEAGKLAPGGRGMGGAGGRAGTADLWEGEGLCGILACRVRPVGKKM